MIGSGTPRPLVGEWAVMSLPPGSARVPADLDNVTPVWIACDGPIPAAAALRASGRHADRSRDFDADDWWYRCRFPGVEIDGRSRLRFDGLATVADAWLNGKHILHSESMFVARTVDVGGILADENELVLRFHALAPLLAARRPRAKWRARMISHHQLRWHRTTLLGRMPSWCPSVAPVGPWRPIFVETSSPLRLEDADIRTDLEGGDGVVRVSVPVTSIAVNDLRRGTLAVGEHTAAAALARDAEGGVVLRATVRVPRADVWWPHTHGRQPLYPVTLAIDVKGEEVAIDLGRVGFRSLNGDFGPDGEGFGLVINGVDVFCRGVCWTPLDIARLDAGAGEYRLALERLRDAGVNMVRVGGTMVYESDAFYDLCDELGILLWQDFMFANMDYPSSDASFDRAVTIEARQLLGRLQGRPSVTVFCGGSEIEQQAAMLGLPAEKWKNPLFEQKLPELVRSLTPDAAWVRSSPSGGLFPFHADRGVSHYYGVGAYLRPFDDARRANVRFASECLAFANVPDAAMVEALRADGVTPGHHPRWKAGVPRDAGAGWDFEDVRDHYVRQLFGVDPVELRSRDADRYLSFGRVASGEAMLRTFAEWRRPGSSCRGGLVWFAHDLSAGAGWGVIDSTGRPKAAYWYLKRAFAPVTLVAADEGLNGLWLHAVNDTQDSIDAELRVSLYREGLPCGTSRSASVTIPGRGACSVHADALFDGFLDLTYAYRFGPPQHDVVAATLRDVATNTMLATAHIYPSGMPTRRDDALGLAARAVRIAGGYAITLEADRFAHAVSIECEGFVPDDNFVNIEPGHPRRITLRAERPDHLFQATVSALNGSGPVPILSVVQAEAAS
jgi:beta-mannosidase